MKTFIVLAIILVALFALFTGLIWLGERDLLEALTTATVVVGGLVGVGVAIVLYFAPSLVAIQRQHTSQSGIVICNILLGWTLLGWAIALVWAASGQHIQQRA